MNQGLAFGLAVAEALLAALVVAVLVGRGGWLGARRRIQRPRLARAARTIAAAAEGQSPDRVAVADLARLPRAAQIFAFGQLGDTLVGAQKQELCRIAGRAGLVEKAEEWCAARRWGQRLRGARLLTLLEGGDEVVPALLDDPRPEVRAQAAQWAGAHPGAESIDRLLTMLGDRETLCRFTVKDALLRIGRPAIEPLLRYLTEVDGDPAAEALELAAGIADPRFLHPALTHCRASHVQTRSKAAALAGAIGGSEATAVLTELLRDDAPEVRSSSAEALGKLRHWPAAGALASCLRDPAWDVRRAAALGLRGLGAAGVLVLRKAMTDSDPFARDMACQVLELPGDGAPAFAAPAATSNAVPEPRSEQALAA
ncbi:MAG TPA: HEAT repeat domain-containing protein [Solirubrobacterales bacterium]|jgi:HEAT repeat protein|nr:HEAT repeat domain-containing protein [Solirubrobacterales bacterium]